MSPQLLLTIVSIASYFGVSTNVVRGNQSVIMRNNLPKSEAELHDWIGKRICIKGGIRLYNNRPIIIADRSEDSLPVTDYGADGTYSGTGSLLGH